MTILITSGIFLKKNMKITTRQDNSNHPFSYHFVGIGGIGMSAIAQVLKEQGHIVSGSDRNYDRHITPSLFSGLISQGISVRPQNGSGVKKDTDFIVISSAIEENNPDIIKAREFNISIIKRANLLAEMFNNKYGIAIGGTNGKTTVSSMVSYILDYANLSPTIIVGGCIKNYSNDSCLGNAKSGTSDIMAIEADESDGSIILYTPRISVITNITKDHNSIEETAKMFETFSHNTQETLILNSDCPQLEKTAFRHKNVVTYGIKNSAAVRAQNIHCEQFRSTFEVNGQTFEINLPGIYNISNALAAIAVSKSLTIGNDKTASALRGFMGVRRRMDIVGEVNGVKVIDDYAHNPQKIMTVLNAIKSGFQRIIAVFQPHGFAPTNFMKEELISAFTNVLSPHDILFMPEIFYAGGTTNKNISSADIIKPINKKGKNAFFVENRDDIIPAIKREVHAGDCIIIMGARDNTLPEFCKKILDSLQDMPKNN